MKGSDNIEMTINIGGELIKLNTKFDEQDNVREVEKDIKSFIDKMRKTLPEESFSNSKIIAMATYRYAEWYHKLLKIQQQAVSLAKQKCHQIDAIAKTDA